MKVSGVYKIQSKIKPDRVYIGSAIDIYQRWRLHLYHLRKNCHGSKFLQRHFNKYGIDDFQFSIILLCDKQFLVSSEQHFLDTYKPLFNNCKVAYSPLGIKHPNMKHADVSGKNNPMYGKYHSDETKNKISEKAQLRIGEKNPFYGKHHSEKSKEKIKLSWVKRKLKSA
jgi:group I intron endonuclease